MLKKCFYMFWGDSTLNPFPHNEEFWRTLRYIAMQNIVTKEKLLVTSKFSFSQNVFYPIWYLFFILNALWNVVCNLFQFGPVYKGEIACNKQILLFSKCFLPYMVLIFHSKCTLKCRLQFVSIWTSLKFCRWKIEIYFIEWTPSVIFSLVAAPLVKILPMVFTRWNKFRSFTENKKTQIFCLFHAFNPFWEKLY